MSVVIPAYRQTMLLEKALLSVLCQDMDPHRYEVIVVDSSPDRENADLLERYRELAACNMRWFVKPAEGPGPSRNLGTREARGQFIAFLDSDCAATPAWLTEGLKAFDDTVGIVQGRTEPEPGVARGIFTDYLTVQRESWLYETANIFYRRDALLACGGFTADLTPHSITPTGGEDTRVAWRVKRLGWETRFAPAAHVHHAVKPISKWQWLVNKRLPVFPELLREFPEFRRFFFLRYFYDANHFAFCLAVAGIAASGIWWPAALLVLPYATLRSAQPSRTLGGIRRPIRALIYAPRDAVSFLLLVTASFRYRCVLL
ncbi:MAG TPA: glycosyltransferase family A protein [Longimicrobiales bacterium]|nr:glycosyltransferase family A protein [Longimicrobiales bacterium]